MKKNPTVPCYLCKKTITGDSFHVIRGEVYCKTCYQEYLITTCRKCGKQMIDRDIPVCVGCDLEI